MTERMARKAIRTVIAVFLFAQTYTAYAADAPADTVGPVQASTYEKVIAHGGGSYKGYETTNSAEAVNSAIASGYKIIELDMDLSSDGRIIMLHDWDRTAEHYFGTTFSRKLTQRQFSDLTVYGRFEILTLDKLAGILEKHKDIRIVTDTKGDNIELLKTLKEQYPKLTDRFIPQIYDYDQWNEVKELGFSDVIFTMYAMASPDLDKLASFVKEHDIYAVTMPDYFAERGYCGRLSGKGVKVYIHPVSSYEDARRFFKLGAYGVYSGSLLPEEFSGIEKDCYLTAADGKGKFVKLTDQTVSKMEDIMMAGLKTGEYVKYFIDDTKNPVTGDDLAACEKGKHKLTAKIYANTGICLGQLEYLLWKEDCLRILHKKYEYRLETWKELKDFDAVMENNPVPDEIKEILGKSFIAKKDEYTFYNNGRAGNYRSGEEFITVQQNTSRNLLLPLNSTALELGAASVSMEKGRDMVINYNNEKIRACIDGYYIRNGFRITRTRTPVSLYLNKAMAGGEVYEYITGRAYIERKDLIIILPKSVTVNKHMEDQLTEAAQKLF